MTEEEKKLYKAFFYRRTATKPMLNEVQETKTKASKVKEGRLPNIPILIFTPNGQGTSVFTRHLYCPLKAYRGCV